VKKVLHYIWSAIGAFLAADPVYPLMGVAQRSAPVASSHTLRTFSHRGATTPRRPIGSGRAIRP
jgi:hypothetical protein